MILQLLRLFEDLSPNWKTNVKSDVILLISAGEEHIGANKEPNGHGAGNHFAEVQVVEASSLANIDNSLQQDNVVLLVHSGSQGLGGNILKKCMTETRTSFEEGSADAIGYMEEHNQAFAKTALRKCRMIDIWHNNVERIAWPPSELWLAGKYASSIYNIVPCDCVYIHRKGAAPTYDPKIQLPLSLLPLPGSRGTPTLILQPTFSTSNAWGLKNGLSLAHGAGCAMSRAKALSASAQKYKGQNILEPRLADLQGTWVICDEKGLVFEEAPDAYKDVQAVSQDLVDADAAQVVGWCRSRISYKVRNETC
ncbi:unnamed protein product [Alternaria alternata]